MNASLPAAPRPIRAFIQARMSSRRFPGKVLAPFRGEPLVRHVIRAVGAAIATDLIVVVTSTDPTDDPLAAYLATLGVACVRGPLDDVFERFRRTAKQFPCDWAVRISADSALLDPAVVRRVIAAGDERWDLVTTIFPRTFPRGQNAEMIRTATMLAVAADDLTADDREHVTSYFYRHAGRFRIVNVESPRPQCGAASCAVDTLEDLRRLETMTDAEIATLSMGAAGR